MNVATMVKLARGGMAQDEIGPLLKAMGIDISFESVPIDREAFGALASSASLPCSKLVRVQGKMKGGESVHALLVITNASAHGHIRK